MGKRPNKRKAAKKSVHPKPLVPEKYETPIFIALMIILLIAFLHQAFFDNKVFISNDINASKSLQTFVDQSKSQGVFPLWIPYVFSGMPSFASLLVGGNRWYDLFPTVWGWIDQAIATILVNKDVGWVLTYYFLFGIGLCVLIRRLGLPKFAAFFGATATLFSTYIIIWIMVGHNTKIAAIAFFPFILLLVMELAKEFRWSYLLALIVAIHLQFQSTHIQMIFYSYLAIGVFLITMLVRNALKKDGITGTVRATVLFVVASAIAFVMSADLYFSVYQYSKYSIRGSSPIVQTAGNTAHNGGGLDYEYATNWSFAPEELATFVDPWFYGFGNIVYKGTFSGGREVRPYTYFGPEIFTDAPEYMGIIVLLLAVIGFIKNRRNPFVLFSMAVIVISLFIAFGKELPIVYNLMFYHFPYFNKFRAPDMILVLVQVFVPILAAFGIDTIIKARENPDLLPAKRMLEWTGVFGGLVLLSLVFQDAIKDMYLPLVQANAAKIAGANRIPEQQVSSILIPQIIFPNMMSGLYAALTLCFLTTGTIYLYLRRNISLMLLGALLTVMLLFDLWRVDYQPMQMFSRRVQSEQFATPDYVNFIKQDTGLYRVLPLQEGQPTTSNDLAYYGLQDASGYSGAKLRIYQDMLDVVGLTNSNIMRLLDIKYVITGRPDTAYGRIVFSGSEAVEENDNILPRAFFVDGYRIANGLQILNSLRTGAFDPGRIAYFETDPHRAVQQPEQGASIQFQHYGLQSMKMKVAATGNNLMVLSEVYYPAGWNAFVDGKPATIYKTDYFLRGIFLTRGVHEVEFRFEPKVYAVGKTLALASNGIVAVGLLILLASNLLRRRQRGAV